MTVTKDAERELYDSRGLDMIDSGDMPIRFTVQEIAVQKGFKTARQLASAAQVSASTVYGMWDNTKLYIHLGALEKIARTLGVSAQLLISDDMAPIEPLDRRNKSRKS